MSTEAGTSCSGYPEPCVHQALLSLISLGKHKQNSVPGTLLPRASDAAPWLIFTRVLSVTPNCGYSLERTTQLKGCLGNPQTYDCSVVWWTVPSLCFGDPFHRDTEGEIMGSDPGGEEDMPLGLGLHFHDQE